MPYTHIWSSADVDAVPADAYSIQLHRVTPQIVSALNRRSSLPDIELAGDDLDDEQVRLLGGIAGLDDIELYGGAGISDEGVAAILNIEGLRHLTFLSAKVTEQALVRLGGHTMIESLSLDNTEHVTDSVIKAIGSLRSLRTLLLMVWEVSHGALAELAGLPSLRLLQICADPVAVDHGPILAHRDLEVLRLYSHGKKKSGREQDDVARMIWGLPKLQELVLSRYSFSEPVLEGVAALRQLRILDLQGNRHFGTAAAQAISRLPNLSVMDIGRAAITDEGLGFLSASRSLMALSLRGCPLITGAGVQQLVQATSLEHLSLKGCQGVPMADAERLAKQVPDCCVQLPDGSQSWSPERIEAHVERQRTLSRGSG